MTTDHFFIALSKTLVESCVQGLAVWSVTRLTLSIVPASSENRYRAYYGALCLVFVGFVATLLVHVGETPVVTPAGGYVPASGAVSAAATVNYLKKGEFLLSGYSLWISVFYLLGLVFNGVNLLSARLQVNQLSRFRQEQSELWKERLIVLKEKLGITKEVRLYFTHIFDVPFTSGFAKPLIYFPLAALNSLSMAQVEALLLHELAHIRRHDYLFNLAQQVMKSFLFFNPFALALNRSIGNEREYCCDDLVVAHAENHVDYAKALLQLEESRAQAPELALAAGGKYPLLNRIKRIIMKTNPQTSFQRSAVLVLGIAVVASLAFVIPSDAHKRAPKHDNLILARPATRPSAPLTEFIPVAVNAPLACPADTIPKKKKKTIIIRDENGNEKTYTSIHELPDSLKGDLAWSDLKFNFKFDSLNHFDNKEFLKYFESDAWKKQQEDAAKYFRSDGWKKQQENLAKYFQSPQWKQQQEATMKYFQSDAWKKQQEATMKYFQSDAWKKQQEAAMTYLKSDAWKSQQDDMQKYFGGDDWKKQVELMRTQAESLAAGSEARKAALEKARAEIDRELKRVNDELKKSEKKSKKN